MCTFAINDDGADALSSGLSPFQKFLVVISNTYIQFISIWQP